MNERPSREETLRLHARVASYRGTCSRLQVGVVIAREGRILVSGYNGAPQGMPHCTHADDQPCTISVHAECNAIAYAARYGIRIEGAHLYTTDSPCLYCAQLIVNAGIVKVDYQRPYRDKSGLVLLEQADVALMSPEVI